MPLISVIIPVYNCEKYLAKCLDSVLNQTLSDIEIICVDDCSKDNSLEILHSYSKKDNRIKVIELLENGGAARARNVGIDIAQGEYIGFVDSDDFIDLDFCEKLYKKAAETGSDIAKGTYKYTTGYINRYLNENIKENYKRFSFEFCSAIFKKDLLINNNIRFPNLCDMEDPVFTYLTANYANNVEVVDYCYDNITIRKDSQTGNIPNKQQIEDKIKGLKMLVEISKDFNVPNTVSGFVLALWIFVILNACRDVEIYQRLNLAEEIFKIYNEYKNKESILFYLNKQSKNITDALKENNITKLCMCNKDNEIAQLKNELSIKTKTIDELDKYAADLANTYCVDKLKESDCGEDIYFISVVNDYKMYDKCVKNNIFVKNPSNIHLVDFDNTKENIIISKRYNSFLNSYDYNKDGWFVFYHCDWQLLEDINNKLKNLDKNTIYGTIGARVILINNKTYRKTSGFCFEKRKEGSGLTIQGETASNLDEADTFDCQCLIVHSSLIKKYNLRFDEKLEWDLYVEDFCINAKLKYGIKSYAIPLYACHWSGYRVTPDSYCKTLEYVNKKYPDKVFSGMVSLIGGKKLQEATQRDILFYNLRKGKFPKND